MDIPSTESLANWPSQCVSLDMDCKEQGLEISLVLGIHSLDEVSAHMVGKKN